MRTSEVIPNRTKGLFKLFFWRGHVAKNQMNDHALEGRINPFWVVLGMFFFQLAASYWVLSQSDVVCIYDEVGRWVGADSFAANFSGVLEKFVDFFALDFGQGHPRFVELIAGLVWGVQKMFGGVDFWPVILWTNAVFGLVLIFGVYGLGSMIYGRQAGLLAAFMVSMLPVVFSQSRVLMLDYPLMCMVTGSFYLLYRTQGFTSWGFGLLFGLSAGLTQLTKEIAIVFLAIPLVYYFARAYASGPKDVVIRCAASAAMVYLIVAGSVYFLPHNAHVFSLYRAKAGMSSIGLSALYYLRVIDKLFGFGFFLLSLPFLLSYFVRLKSKDLFLLCWFFVLLALLSFSPNKSPRFLLPLIPAFALIVSGEAVRHLRSGWVGAVGCGALIVALAVQFYSANLSLRSNADSNPTDDGRPSVYRDGNSLTRKQLIDVFDHEFRGAHFNRHQMVVPVFSAPNLLDFMGFEFASKRMPFMLEQPLQHDLPAIRSIQWRDRPERILQADYVLAAVGNVPGRRSPVHSFHTPGKKVPADPLERVLEAGFNGYKDHFEKISEISLNTGARIEIYRKRTEASQVDEDKRTEHTPSQGFRNFLFV